MASRLPGSAARLERAGEVVAFAVSDEALLEGLRSGQGSAVLALFDRYGRHVERVVARILGADSESNGYADEDLRASNFVDLIHMAFACDLARVVSLQITSSMSGIVLPTSLGITYRNWDNSPLPPPPLHEATHGKGNNLSVAECIRWHVKHLAALAKKLKDTPDVSGSMLDNTVIVFQMEAGLGNSSLQGTSIVGEPPPHTSEGMVAVVIGGKSLGMQLGTHLVATDQHPASVSLTAMRAVGGSQIAALGEINAEITGLRS